MKMSARNDNTFQDSDLPSSDLKTDANSCLSAQNVCQENMRQSPNNEGRALEIQELEMQDDVYLILKTKNENGNIFLVIKSSSASSDDFLAKEDSLGCGIPSIESGKRHVYQINVESSNENVSSNPVAPDGECRKNPNTDGSPLDESYDASISSQGNSSSDSKSLSFPPLPSGKNRLKDIFETANFRKTNLKIDSPKKEATDSVNFDGDISNPGKLFGGVAGERKGEQEIKECESELIGRSNPSNSSDEGNSSESSVSILRLSGDAPSYSHEAPILDHQIIDSPQQTDEDIPVIGYKQVEGSTELRPDKVIGTIRSASHSYISSGPMNVINAALIIGSDAVLMNGSNAAMMNVSNAAIMNESNAEFVRQFIDPLPNHNGPSFQPGNQLLGEASGNHNQVVPKKCSFCFARDHYLKVQGMVQCPILLRYVCPICGVKGRHSLKWCPQNPVTRGRPTMVKLPRGRTSEPAKREMLRRANKKDERCRFCRSKNLDDNHIMEIDGKPVCKEFAKAFCDRCKNSGHCAKFCPLRGKRKREEERPANNDNPGTNNGSPPPLENADQESSAEMHPPRKMTNNRPGEASDSQGQGANGKEEISYRDFDEMKEQGRFPNCPFLESLRPSFSSSSDSDRSLCNLSKATALADKDKGSDKSVKSAQKSDAANCVQPNNPSQVEPSAQTQQQNQTQDGRTAVSAGPEPSQDRTSNGSVEELEGRQQLQKESDETRSDGPQGEQ